MRIRNLKSTGRDIYCYNYFDLTIILQNIIVYYPRITLGNGDFLFYMITIIFKHG